jgi:Tfp pilus assembly protein PilF
MEEGMIHRSVLAVVIGMVGFIGLVLGSCAGGEGRSTREIALTAPPKSVPAAAAAIDEGNKQFYARQWEAAKAQYETAIQAQPTLAEAHYNLGLVYDVLRNDKEARKHFVEAANLAPGNKIIWSSPALRQHGDVLTSPKSGDFFSPGHH